MDAHTILGATDAGDDVCLSLETRLRHMLVIGSTGVGKSTLLRRIVADDIARGDGGMLIDPHSDLAEAVLDHVPRQRHNHVCYLNVADIEHPVAVNVLQDTQADHRARAVDAVVSAMRAIWHDSWGPRLELILRYSLMAMMENGGSLALVPRLLTDATYRGRVLERVSDPMTLGFFAGQYDVWTASFRDEAIVSVLNKLQPFLAFPHVRNIFGQVRSSLDLQYAMARQHVVIVNLAKGLIGETAAYLAGSLLVGHLQAATLGRAGDRERPPWHLVIDEAQNIGTEALVSLLSEGRKFGLSVCLATQYLSALSETTRAALLGNVGCLVCFRVGPEDAEILSPVFDRTHQSFNPRALQDLARGEAMVMIAGEDAKRVRVSPAPDGLGTADVVKRQSIRHYSRARKAVEQKLARALGYAQSQVVPLEQRGY
jgi:hypothetical protein